MVRQLLTENIIKKISYLIIVQIIFVAVGYSQNYVDLLKITGSTTPLNTFDSSNSKSVLNEYSADLSIPVKLNDKSVFLTGVTYEGFQTKLFANENMQNVSSVSLKLGFVYNFNERLSFTGVALPKIASNFGQLSNKDFQLGGIAIFKYSKSKTLNYRYGLYYNSEKFAPFFVPLLGIYYLSNNSKLEINVMLPLSVDINYKIIKWMHLGVNFNGQTRSYHLTNVNSSVPDSYVSRVTNELFGYLRFNITKNIILQTKIGQSVGRRYRVFKEGDRTDLAFPLTYINDHRKQLNHNFSDGLIFQFSIIYRLNLK